MIRRFSYGAAIVFGSVALLLGVLGCGGGGGGGGAGDGGEAAPLTGNIYGYVKHFGSQEPLAGIDAIADGKATKTDGTGHYALSGIHHDSPLFVEGSIGGITYTMMAPQTIVIEAGAANTRQPLVLMVASPPNDPSM